MPKMSGLGGVVSVVEGKLKVKRLLKLKVEYHLTLPLLAGKNSHHGRFQEKSCVSKSLHWVAI